MHSRAKITTTKARLVKAAVKKLLKQAFQKPGDSKKTRFQAISEKLSYEKIPGCFCNVLKNKTNTGTRKVTLRTAKKTKFMNIARIFLGLRLFDSEIFRLSKT